MLLRDKGGFAHPNATNIAKWRNVWIITIVILTVDTITFFVFADGNPQKWNAPTDKVVKDGKKDWFLVILNLLIQRMDTFLLDMFHIWYCYRA